MPSEGRAVTCCELWSDDQDKLQSRPGRSRKTGGPALSGGSAEPLSGHRKADEAGARRKKPPHGVSWEWHDLALHSFSRTCASVWPSGGGSLRMVDYGVTVTVAAVLLLSGAAAQSVGDACSEDGSRAALYSEDCRSYLQCQQGKYVNLQCESPLQFDSKLLRCIWSPLATCLQNLEGLFEEEKAKIVCDVEGGCTRNVAVKADCHYYCPCISNIVGAPVKCILNRYYDAVNDECREDDSVCDLVPTTLAPDTPCTKENEKRVFPGNCKKYYQCINKKLETETCGLLSYFNPKTLSCEHFLFSTPSYCK